MNTTLQRSLENMSGSGERERSTGSSTTASKSSRRWYPWYISAPTQAVIREDVERHAGLTDLSSGHVGAGFRGPESEPTSAFTYKPTPQPTLPALQRGGRTPPLPTRSSQDSGRISGERSTRGSSQEREGGRGSHDKDTSKVAPTATVAVDSSLTDSKAVPSRAASSILVSSAEGVFVVDRKLAKNTDNYKNLYHSATGRDASGATSQRSGKRWVYLPPVAKQNSDSPSVFVVEQPPDSSVFSSSSAPLPHLSPSLLVGAARRDNTPELPPSSAERRNRSSHVSWTVTGAEGDQGSKDNSEPRQGSVNESTDGSVSWPLSDGDSLRDVYIARCEALGLKKPNAVVLSQLPAEAVADVSGGGVGRELSELVEVLDFHSTYLGSRGCLAVAAIFPMCQNLRYVNFSGAGFVCNNTSTEGASGRRVLRALHDCSGLVGLNLSRTDIDDTGGRWLLSLLLANTSICEVDVRDTHLSAATLQPMQNLLARRGGRCEQNTAALPLLPLARGDRTLEGLNGSYRLNGEDPKNCTIPRILLGIQQKKEGGSSDSVCSSARFSYMDNLYSRRDSSLNGTRVSVHSAADGSFYDMEDTEDDEDGSLGSPQQRRAQRVVPPFVAAALVELRQRLLRNRHCLQRVYDCFILPDSVERDVRMGATALSAHVPTGSLPRERARTLVHMELLGAALSEEALQRVQQGTCTWKVFFRGLRLLGVHSASKNLSQAISFASACGVLCADSVQFGKLINMLRPHAVVVVAQTYAGRAPLREGQLGTAAPRTRIVALHDGAAVLEEHKRQHNVSDVYDNSPMYAKVHPTTPHHFSSHNTSVRVTSPRAASHFNQHLAPASSASSSQGRASPGVDGSNAPQDRYALTARTEDTSPSDHEDMAADTITARSLAGEGRFSLSMPRQSSQFSGQPSPMPVPPQHLLPSFLPPMSTSPCVGQLEGSQQGRSRFDMTQGSVSASFIPSMLVSRADLPTSPMHTQKSPSVCSGASIPRAAGRAGAPSSSLVQSPKGQQRRRSVTWRATELREVLDSDGLAAPISAFEVQFVMDRLFDARHALRRCLEAVALDLLDEQEHRPSQHRSVLTPYISYEASLTSPYHNRESVAPQYMPTSPSVPRQESALPRRRSSFHLRVPSNATSSHHHPPRALLTHHHTAQNPRRGASGKGNAQGTDTLSQASTCQWPIVEATVADGTDSEEENPFGGPATADDANDDDAPMTTVTTFSKYTTSAEWDNSDGPTKAVVTARPGARDDDAVRFPPPPPLPADATEETRAPAAHSGPLKVPVETLYNFCTAIVGAARQGVLQCVLRHCGVTLPHGEAVGMGAPREGRQMVDYEATLLSKLKLRRGEEHASAFPTLPHLSSNDTAGKDKSAAQSGPNHHQLLVDEGRPLAPQEAVEVWSSMTIVELQQIIAPF